MPEKIFEKFKSNLQPQWKTCFFTAVILGLVAHLYKITNWLPNWDSLVFRYDSQNMVAMGRWFLPVASAPSSFYDLPWITGLLAILLHAIAAVCICQIFSVKKNLTAALIGGAVVTFPTVTSVLLYNYVADAYALSFLLSCLAALFLTKEKPNYILSAVFIALSVGIYQAYITVTIMLLLCYLIIILLEQNIKFKDFFLKCLKFLATGASGMALYYLILTVILKLTGTELLDYQGFNNATSLSGIDILASLYIVKNTFTTYFFDFSKGLNLFALLNVAVFVFTVLFYVCNLFKNKIGIIKTVIMAVLVALLPVGACVLAFINSSIDYHNLMKMGFFVFYLFFILQYEKTIFKNEKLNLIKLWTVFAVTAIIICNQIVIANVSYHKIGMAYEKSYGTLVRIADRIEQTEGSADCNKILVLGHLHESEEYSAYLPPEITGTTDGYILRADDEIVGQSVLCSALNDYCGTKYDFVYGTEKENLIKKINSESINTWPSAGSVLVVDDVVVIKLGN